MGHVHLGPLAIDADDARAVHEWLGEQKWGYDLYHALDAAIEQGEDFPVTVGEVLIDLADETEWRIVLSTSEYVVGVDGTGTKSRFWSYYGGQAADAAHLQRDGVEAAWPWDQEP